MKKTAMIVAMSCVLLCPSAADAAQCGSAEPWFNLGGSVKRPDNTRVRSLHIAGRLSMTLAQLEKQQQLASLNLQIMEETGGFVRSNPFQVRREPDGSACLEFLNLHTSQNGHMMNVFSGTGRGFPEVCISPEGWVSSKLEVDERGKIDHIRITTGASTSASGILFDAGSGGCNAHCPTGKSTLLFESTTKNRARSTTDSVVAVVGRAPFTLKSFQAGYDISRTVLDVGQNYTYFGARPPVKLELMRLSDQADGSVCMVFDEYHSSRDAVSGLANVADAKESSPQVCISKDGVISGKLKVDVSGGILAVDDPAQPDIYVRVRTPILNKHEEVMVVNADPKGCQI